MSLSGIAIAKTINGTSGNNVLQGTPYADVINAYAGDDRVFAHEGNDTVYGGPNFDQLKGGPGNDRVFGGDGDDGYKWVYRTSWPSYCGPYTDILNYTTNPVCALEGGSGNDEVSGGYGRDVIIGGPGSDYLHGDAQADVILAYGDGSADIVQAGDPDESKVGNWIGIGDWCLVDANDIVSGCLPICPAYPWAECPGVVYPRGLGRAAQRLATELRTPSSG